MGKHKWKFTFSNSYLNEHLEIPLPLAEEIVEFLEKDHWDCCFDDVARTILSQLIETKAGSADKNSGEIGGPPDNLEAGSKVHGDCRSTTAKEPAPILFYVHEGEAYRCSHGVGSGIPNKFWVKMCECGATVNFMDCYGPLIKCPTCTPEKYFEYREGIECERAAHGPKHKKADGILFHDNIHQRFYVWCKSCAEEMLRRNNIHVHPPFIPFASFPGLGEKRAYKKQIDPLPPGSIVSIPTATPPIPQMDVCGIIKKPEEFTMIEVKAMSKYHTDSDIMPHTETKRERNDDPIKIKVVEEIPYTPEYNSDYD